MEFTGWVLGYKAKDKSLTAKARPSLRDKPKRRRAAALVRLGAYMVREVRVLFRHAFSGL